MKKVKHNFIFLMQRSILIVLKKKTVVRKPFESEFINPIDLKYTLQLIIVWVSRCCWLLIFLALTVYAEYVYLCWCISLLQYTNCYFDIVFSIIKNQYLKTVNYSTLIAISCSVVLRSEVQKKPFKKSWLSYKDRISHWKLNIII